MSSVLSFTPPVPGRKADVLVYHTDTPFQLTLTDQKVFEGSGGLACVGLQKLAQQVALRLYTRSDGKVYEPNEGNSFVNKITSGLIRTSVDAQNAFAVAREDLLTQFRRDVLNDLSIPLDERLRDLELISAIVQGDELSLTFNVVSLAGETSQFVFPVPVS